MKLIAREKLFRRISLVIVFGLISTFAFLKIQNVNSQSFTQGYNNLIPGKILTPDILKTRIGDLKFFDGYPDKDTVEMVYNNLDFMRGVDGFMKGIPGANFQALYSSIAEMGVSKVNDMVLFETLMDSNSLFLTGNTDTVYAMTMLDLKRDGPIVIEVPAATGPGMINDSWFRYVADVGPVGPAKGKGGKHLILPPGYQGKIPTGYFVSESKSYANIFLIRGFLKDGKSDFSVKLFKDHLKVYPLSTVKNPPKMEFINGSGSKVNTIHASNAEIFLEVNNVIQREPLSFLDLETRGLFASLGIKKGTEFKPTERMKKILIEAAEVGNATVRALSFRNRDITNSLYEGSSWFNPFSKESYEWLVDKGVGGRDLDGRAFYFYVATFNSPGMTLKLIGKGSKYAMNALDNHGEYLDGAMNYRVNIPANVPATNFWSLVAYDPQTRSELQTDQPFPSRNNKKHKFVTNKNGSVDIYFGPKAPKGMEKNWIQTVPGKGWFVLLRLYGPLEPWYDKTWRPGEIELIK